MLPAVQQVLASRVRGANVLTSLVVAQDFLWAWLEGLPQHAAQPYSKCSGAVTQTSVYLRKVVKDVLALSSSALLLAHCHPSARAEPSRVDEQLTQMQKEAAEPVDVWVLDHPFVAGGPFLLMAERGLL